MTRGSRTSTYLAALGAAALMSLWPGLSSWRGEASAPIQSSGWTLSEGVAWAAAAARPVVREATRTDTTQPLRAMPEIPPKPEILGQILEKPRKTLPNRIGSTGPSGDAALQESGGEPAAPTIGANFEGVNNVNGVLPPDTVGDIGPNHYVQMVNLSFAVWNRSSGTKYGPVANKTLWQGFGGPCETENDGDPIVLYDNLADRWMMSQFALPNFPNGPFYQCIAVSQTGDPLGAWHRYEFTISQDKLNDYPKFGVWSDGYYMAVNQFKCSIFSCSWGGQGVVVFERDKMLLGLPARMVSFDLYTVDRNLGGMLPSDLDGPAPPAGAPNYFIEVDDDAWGYSPDQLQIWKFATNWSNPASSTFTKVGALATAAFDSDMCGYSRNCIPQPGGTRLDAISDRLMYRLQYRNFGSRQTLVTNHTVDVGSDRAGARWYELRNTGGDWSIYQQGTFAPLDTNHRWMASAAMNGAGDIALGYSVSSTIVSPSIWFTGRLDGVLPLGQMTQGEGTIIDGSGYQQHSSGRWGDYSAMSVDPLDDCTFWYTQEYYASVGTAPWRTRVGSFELAACGTPAPTPTPTPTPAPTPTPTMHVGDLDGSKSNQGNKKWSATVTILVHDAGDAAVGSATVSGTWSFGASGTSSCITNGSGVCSVTKGGMFKSTGSVTFTVTGVTRAGYTYISASNHDPDVPLDSNGTTIVVTKP